MQIYTYQPWKNPTEATNSCSD